MKKMNIYVVSHKKANFPEEEIYVPIQVGNKEQFADVRDNQKDNIAEKNANYCELTAAYWILKNDNSDITGLTHYRRYFFKSKFSNDIKNIINRKDIEEILENYDIILPQKEHIVKYTVREAYKHFHHIEDLDKCREIIQKITPEYVEAFDKVANGKKVYLYNMFISNKKIYNEYYDWLFKILFELEKHVNIENYTDYDKRIYGFLSERLLNVWIEKNKHLKIKELPVYNTEEKVMPQLIRRTIQKILVK